MSAPASAFKKMRVMVSVHHAVMLAYRAEIYLWVIGSILPFIMMSIWTKAAGSASASHFSMTSMEYVRYFLAVFIVRQFSIVWFIYDFEWQVVEGRLSYHLLRPMNALWNYVAAHFAEQLARFPFFLLIVILFFCLYPTAFWVPSIGSLAVGITSIYAAFAVRFALQYCVTMMTFWFERASALDQLLMVPYLFLSGFIIPLDDFPPHVAALLRLMPFPYLIDFQARILTGQLPVSSPRLYEGFAVMTIWFLLFSALGAFLWKRGIRRYAGQGA